MPLCAQTHWGSTVGGPCTLPCHLLCPRSPTGAPGVDHPPAPRDGRLLHADLPRPRRAAPPADRAPGGWWVLLLRGGLPHTPLLTAAWRPDTAHSALMSSTAALCLASRIVTHRLIRSRLSLGVLATCAILSSLPTQLFLQIHVFAFLIRWFVDQRYKHLYQLACSGTASLEEAEELAPKDALALAQAGDIRRRLSKGRPKYTTLFTSRHKASGLEG